MPSQFSREAPSFDLLDPELSKLLKQHEEALQFPRFSKAIAWDLGNALRSKFHEKYPSSPSGANKGAIIQIRAFPYANATLPNMLFASVVGAEEATNADNASWANGKANVVARYGRSSFRVGRDTAIAGGTPEGRGMPFPEYACHGGGFPILLKNSSVGPVGVILVSGLPQAEDHQLIVDTLESFLPTLSS